MPDRVVLDASAVIDAASPGPRFDLLTRLHERFAPAAPMLLAWELGNVAHGRNARAFGSDARNRSDAIELMLAGIELVPSDAASRAACGALSARHGLTFYDAAYLELASRDDESVLVAQDAKLLRAASTQLGVERAMRVDDVPALLARLGA